MKPACSISIFERTCLIIVGPISYFFSTGLEDWNGEIPVMIRLDLTDNWKMTLD